jgi:hypothetical protein
MLMLSEALWGAIHLLISDTLFCHLESKEAANLKHAWDQEATAFRLQRSIRRK